MSIIANLTQWILNFVHQLGYLGIFIGMSIESSFIPFPSEIILIPAGALIAQGKLSFLPIIILAIAGSLAGAYINYLIGEHLGRRAVNKLVKKYGKIFLITEEKLVKADKYFHKHGKITIFIGRLIPGIRQIISIPAGFAKMNKKLFFTYTALGAGIWSLILIYIGYAFGNNPLLIQENKMLFIYLAIIFSAIGIFFYIKNKIKKKPSSHQE